MPNKKYAKFVDETMENNATLTADHSNVDFHPKRMERNGATDHNVIEVDKTGHDEYQEFPVYLTRLTLREKLRRFVENIMFRLFSLVLIIIDCILLVVDLTTGPKAPHEQQVFDVVALIFVFYFCVEVGLRIYAKGYREFFSEWYNSVDFVVVLISLIVTVVYTALDSVTSIAKLIVLGRFVRAAVLIRLIRVFVTEPKNLQTGIRHTVSENKRRMRAQGFDLDLTYVTERLIGMSYPSSGKMAIYRNHIKDVAKYMDLKHGPDNYKIYNLCSERSYDSSYFHGRVSRVMVDDHNVPSLEQMMEFVKDVQEWLDEDGKHIVAIHCLGGKGRTGTMICAYLLYCKQFDSPQKALDFFADRRTDKSVGEKFQGVETPSQSRYVEYFHKVLTTFNGRPPSKVPLTLDAIRIYSMAGVGVGDGSDFTCSIYINRETTFICDLGVGTNCQADYNSEKDELVIKVLNCPTLFGDVRIKFNCKSKSVPKAYENCAFYFWFNTGFVDVVEKRLQLDRIQLDNPHKNKTWKLYRQHFGVELTFREYNN